MLRTVARIFGVVFLLVGILGFVQAGTDMNADPVTAPKLLGLFPVNLVHNVVHLVFGAWGIAAGGSYGAARTYCRVAGAIYVVLTVLGYFVPDGFGLVPLGGHDIWLHAVLGLSLLGAGFALRDDAAPAGGATVGRA